MAAISKKEADAYDRVIEAAMRLGDLLQSQGIEMDEYDLETLTFFLAANAPTIRGILNIVPERNKRPLTVDGEG